MTPDTTDNNSKRYAFVGYASIYNYYAYPEHVRPRIALVLLTVMTHMGKSHMGKSIWAKVTWAKVTWAKTIWANVTWAK